MAKILYASQWFYPENSRRGLQIAHGLRARGHHVEVLTGFPNYPNGILHRGYRLRPYMREKIEGVQVHRVFLMPSHSRSSIGRIANYVSFFFSALIFFLMASRKFDVIYVYHPPITVGMAVGLAGLVTRRPFVLDVQDLWPESVAVSGMNGTSIFARMIAPLCRFTYRRARLVIGQSSSMTSRLIERGVPKEWAMTNFNWADEDAAKPRAVYDVSSLGFSGRFNFVFGGNLGRVQRLDVVIKAVRAAALEEPRIQLTLIGDGVERENLGKLVAELGAESCVQFRPAVPVDQVGDVFAAADVLVIHLADDPLFEMTIPSKTQFCLAMGRPILIGVPGEAANIVTTAKAGIATTPENVDEMKSAMLRMASMSKSELAAMGAAGRQAYAANFSMATALARINDAIARVVGDAQGSAAHWRT